MGRHHNISGFLFILGLAVGTVFGILYAPKSGKETREMLKNAAEEHQDMIDKTKYTADELIEKTKIHIEGLIDDLSKKIDEKIEKSKDKV